MEKKQKIEDKLSQILDYIKEYINEYGYSPSIREISYSLNIKSTSTVFGYVEKLKQKGLLTKTKQKNRTLSIEKTNNTISIPLLGEVTAGNPILAEQNIDEVFSLPKTLFGENDLYMLKVKGNSMTGAGIFNGDKIIVKMQSHANIGDIVVAIVDDDRATVKRYIKKNDKIILKAENPDYKDIISDNIRISGKVVGLLRQI